MSCSIYSFNFTWHNAHAATKGDMRQTLLRLGERVIKHVTKQIERGVSFGGGWLVCGDARGEGEVQ